MTRFKAVVEATVMAGLAVHTVMTVFENTPDAKVSFAHVSRRAAGIPHWRFFAPNPGIEDTHLVLRHRNGLGWSMWTEFHVKNPVRWHALLWNPLGRSPKVLFDTAQQLLLMSGLGLPFEQTVTTDAYRLLSAVVTDKVAADKSDAQECQFMLFTTLPGGEVLPDGHPVLVSEVIPVS